MTTFNRPAPRPAIGPARPLSDPTKPRPGTNGTGPEPDTELEPDATASYGLDGFTPKRTTDGSGAADPHDSIDLEGLAEQVYLLLLREAYIERERLGPR